jgi:4-hydroxythreonine-4-phosphate dehydrogenase
MASERTPTAPLDVSASPRQRYLPRVGISLGDPNGIGPEVVLKALADTRLYRFVRPFAIGSAHVLHHHASHLGFSSVKIRTVDTPPESCSEDVLYVLDPDPDATPRVQFGKATKAGGKVAMQAVERATDLCREGAIDAMVTAPISKEAISKAGYDYPGHTEFISERVGADDHHTMMLVSDELRVGLVTGHMPVWDIPKHVTCDRILQKIAIIDEALREDFGIQRPKIALLGLNPHAGDGGVLGREEIESIVPAIKKAREGGYLVYGPFPADSFFGIGGYQLHDAVLAMYHDQGLVPFKTLAFESGINYTAGLPIVRMSPDHGTAYNIAGEGQASPGSLRAALYLAIDVVHQRRKRASTPA